MTDFRRVTEILSVSPQIALDDLHQAASQGFVLVINNRPDGEEPGQPGSATIEAATRALGLNYLYVPVRGGPTPDQVETVRQAVAAAKGPVLAYCRSGTRSCNLWALAAAKAGRNPTLIVMQAEGAGYDLSGLRPTLDALAGNAG